MKPDTLNGSWLLAKQICAEGFPTNQSDDKPVNATPEDKYGDNKNESIDLKSVDKLNLINLCPVNFYAYFWKFNK